MSTHWAGGTSTGMNTCNCIGPQNGAPRCPCMMRMVVIRNGRYIEPEHDLGPVVTPARTAPISVPTVASGCICPAGAEATCKGPLCPRKPFDGATC